MIGALLILALGFGVYALCSASETGLFAANPLKLRHAARQAAGAALLLRLLRSPAAFLATLVVAINLANDAMVQSAIALLADAGVRDASLWATILLTPTLFLLGDLLPKQWMAVHAETAMPALAWPLVVLRVLLLPISLPLQAFARLFEPRRDRGAVLGRQQWAALLREGEGSAPGEARVMGAALRALEARGRGLAPFLRPGIPLLPGAASREEALAALARAPGFLLVQRDAGPPALLTGARLLHADPSRAPAALATPLLPLAADCDLAGAFAAMREGGVGLAWSPGAKGRSPAGLLDLEYALSLLIAPPAAEAPGPA